MRSIFHGSRLSKHILRVLVNSLDAVENLRLVTVHGWILKNENGRVVICIRPCVPAMCIMSTGTPFCVNAVSFVAWKHLKDKHVLWL